MPVSEATYERVALEEPEGQWELACEGLRGKPGMTLEHNDVCENLVEALVAQFDRRQYRVRWNGARLKVSDGRCYVPDVVVVPVGQKAGIAGTRRLVAYSELCRSRSRSAREGYFASFAT